MKHNSDKKFDDKYITYQLFNNDKIIDVFTVYFYSMITTRCKDYKNVNLPIWLTV